MCMYDARIDNDHADDDRIAHLFLTSTIPPAGIPTRTVIDERSRKVVLALGPAPMRELNPLLSELKEL